MSDFDDMSADWRPEWMRLIEEGVHLAASKGWRLCENVSFVMDSGDRVSTPITVARRWEDEQHG